MIRQVQVKAIGKKLRSAETPAGAVRRPKKIETIVQPPTFVLDDHLDDTVEQAKSPKPPSAEEFKSMLSEGLTNVTKKEQLDQMMT